MPTYFVWSPNDSYDPRDHLINELKIFQLVISQREGEVAMAKLQIPVAEKLKYSKDWGYIIYEEKNKEAHLLFKGRLIGFPREIHKGVIEIELSAEPLDAKLQLKQLANFLKVFPYYDDLFVKAEDDNPVNVLEARHDLFHWPRTTGQLSLSNLFNGERVVDISAFILADTLKLKLGDMPIDAINVNLSAEWVQKAEGEINIYPKIAGCFSKRFINTLTPFDLKALWPKVGDKVGPALSRKQSGYQVVQGHLKEITPPTTGLLNFYPTLTPEITIIKDEKPKPIRLRRAWFKGNLFIHWHYYQKRKETVIFTLDQESQLKGKIRSHQKSLNLQLQSIEKHLPHSGCSSFFLTDRGKQAVDHAIEVAKAHLAGSSRAIEVECMLLFDQAIQLSLKDSVRICSAEIPGGELVGKIVEYKLIQKGLKAYGWLRLGVAVGNGIKAPEENHTLENFSEEGYLQNISISKFYAPYVQQDPKEGLLYPQNLTVHDLVTSISVKNDAETQIRILLEKEYPETDNAVQLLNQYPTTIDLELLDLRTKPLLEHTIHLDILHAWSAPKQMRLN